MTRRQAPAMKAAGKRVDAANACLTAEEQRVMAAGFAPCNSDEDLAAIHNGLGLTYDEFVAIIQSACDKLDAHFAGVDAAQARRGGRLQ